MYVQTRIYCLSRDYNLLNDNRLCHGIQVNCKILDRGWTMYPHYYPNTSWDAIATASHSQVVTTWILNTGTGAKKQNCMPVSPGPYHLLFRTHVQKHDDNAPLYRFITPTIRPGVFYHLGYPHARRTSMMSISKPRDHPGNEMKVLYGSHGSVHGSHNSQDKGWV